ncbi:MAG: hypothetical protein ACOCRK_05750 [bacterium]
MDDMLKDMLESKYQMCANCGELKLFPEDFHEETSICNECENKHKIKLPTF